MNQVIKLKKSFPQLPAEFFDVFCDRVKENGFDDERLKDSINHVIDNCVYPQPSIAQFISFDKRIEIYNYLEKCKLVEEYGKEIYNSIKAIRITGYSKPFWAKIQDIKEYNLKLWK